MLEINRDDSRLALAGKSPAHHALNHLAVSANGNRLPLAPSAAALANTRMIVGVISRLDATAPR